MAAVVKKSHPSKVVIDRFILEPTEQSIRISKALNQKDKIISDLRVQISTLMKNFEQVKLQGL